ncbi:MAG: hypothetical protein IKE89_03450 [Bacilli bacterium]|nr:hypothetical protein [Bacilli bacterium]MBR2711507.1 hypothetical protein [Bacilli bacterium]
MGTIADKLSYLNDTKQLIKNSINSLGGNLTSESTFRSYANVLNNIYDSLPKVSGTGSSISLSPTRKGRLGSVINGDTFQQTYTGKNLFDGQIELGGIDDSTGQPYNNNNALRSKNYIEVQSNTIYTFSNNKNYHMRIYEYNSNKEIIQMISTLFQGTATFTTTTNTKYIKFRTLSSPAENDLTSLWQLEIGSSATSYEPFVGGQPSPSPDYPQEIKLVTGLQKVSVEGKNLLSAGQESYTFTANTNNNNQPVIGTLKLVSGTKYYISYDIDTQMSSNTRSTPRILLEGSTYYQSGSTNYNLTTGRKVWEFTAPATGEATLTYWSHTPNVDLTVSKFMISTSSDTTYQPYQTPQEYEINLGDIHLYENDQITGTPDNWSIIHNKVENIIDGTSNITYESETSTPTQRTVFRVNIENGATTSQYLSNRFIEGSTTSNRLVMSGYRPYISLDNTITGINTSDTNTEKINKLKTWLSTNNVSIVFALGTPTTEAITNQEIINQLNEIYNLQSYNGTTNISVEGDLQMILDVSALKEVE